MTLENNKNCVILKLDFLGVAIMKKKKTKDAEIRRLTPVELVEEERVYQACKKPIKIAWGIYTAAAALYLFSGLFTQRALMDIPKLNPPAETLSGYRDTDEYNEFIRDTQHEAIRQLTQGEITKEEYDYITSTISSDEKFEEFLRTLKEDKKVQQVLSNYDENQEQLDILGKKYAATSITGLSGVMVATLILGKYRFKEMEIEENREKRAKEFGEQEDFVK